jgi:molecular chaperone DnaK
MGPRVLLVCSLLFRTLRGGSASAVGFAVGIDLGTTNSVIGVADLETDTVEILPSRPFFPLRSQVNTGADTNMLKVDSDSCVSMAEGTAAYGIKRIIGRKAHETGVLRAMEQLRDFVSELPDGTLEVRLRLRDGVQMYPPEFISAAILARLRWHAEHYLDSNVTNAVITVPAYFTATQKEATVTAAIIAGFETPPLIPEPVAAALSYAASPRGKKLVAGEHILVFDLGGGTFDVGVIRFNGKMDLSVLAIGGDQSLGGDDLDDAIVTWLIGDRPISPSDRGLARCELKRLAENAKRRLSDASAVHIEVPAYRLLKGGQFGEASTRKLDRETFDKLARPIFDRLMPIVDQVVQDAKLTTDDIMHLLLVGGSSRIPQLQSMLRENFGEKWVTNSAVHVLDDTAVAEGAAIYARSLFGSESRPSVTLENVVPLPLGTSMCSNKFQTKYELQKCQASPNLQNSVFSELLPKGTRLPARGSRKYYTMRDNQPTMTIDILEGGDWIAGDNSQLGNFELELPPGKRGEVGCDITFMLDEDGRFSAQASAMKKGPKGEEVSSEAAFDMQGLYQKSMPPDRICKYHAELHRRLPEYLRPRETVCSARRLAPNFLCSQYLEGGQCVQAEEWLSTKERVLTKGFQILGIIVALTFLRYTCSYILHVYRSLTIDYPKTIRKAPASEAAPSQAHIQTSAGHSAEQAGDDRSREKDPGPFLGRDCKDCKDCKEGGVVGNEYMCFISHHQEVLTGFARTLQLLIESELGRRQIRPAKVWLDMTERATRQGMHDGIVGSAYFIMFMSAKMLTPRANGQNWCIQEVQWALQHRKPIVIVYQTNPNWGGVPGSFSEFYLKEIKRAFPASEDREWIMNNNYNEYQHRGEFDQAMLQRILREMPLASDQRNATAAPGDSNALEQSVAECTRRYAQFAVKDELARQCIGSDPLLSSSRPLPQLKRWHFFISHQQQGSDGYAALVKEKLTALGYRCWIDTEQHADRDGMEDGVKGSVCVLLFLFKGTLHRPFCRFELRLACAHGVPIVALFEGDHYRDTYVSAPDLRAVFDRGELPADLRCIVEKADWNFFYRRQPHENAAMISRLCEKLEAATAVGAWPALTPAPDASGGADRVASAHRMLEEEELRAQDARSTAAPSKSH